MKKFRKLAALGVALTMALSLMACGSSGSSSSSSSETEAAATEAAAEAEAPAAEAEAPESGSTAAGGTFKMGFIGPLTGDAAIYGIAARNGAKIAVDEINALGGDIQFEFKDEDDTHDAETSVNAYNTLKDWGMQILAGPVTTTPSISVAAETNADRIFAITPSASSTDVINGNDTMYQVCFTDPNQGTGSAQYIAANLGVSNVGVIYQNDDAYSQGIRDTFVAEAANQGLNVVYEGTFTSDTGTDFSVQLQAAQEAGAELLFLPMYYTPASVILNQANSMGYEPLYFGVDGMDGILTLEGFDTSLAEGVYLLTPFSADATDELTQNFVATYNDLYGETPNQFAADGYDVVYVYYNALQAAGVSADMSAQEICEALIDTITTISVDGLTGQGMTWAASGEVSKDPMAVVIKDGVYVTP